MTDWLHDKALELISLLLAIIGGCGAYINSQRKLAARREQVNAHLAKHDIEISLIHKRLEEGDESLVNEYTCQSRRENLQQQVHIYENQEHNKIERRIDSIEHKMDEVVRGQLEVHQGQTRLTESQETVTSILSELVDRLSRRSADRGPHNRRMEDE